MKSNLKKINRFFFNRNKILRTNTLVIFSFSLFFLFSINFAKPLFAQIKFQDDFEGDLSGWELVGGQAIKIIESNNSEQGRVLELKPDDAVYALIKNSNQWGSVCVEGEVLFPDAKHNYLGLIYNYTCTDTRTDFGSIYIKGNGSYLRANPRRDGNASRLLYEEYKTVLAGDQKIIINQWHKFKAEIKGNLCHFYVGDMLTPKMTFDLFEKATGLLGFKPRVAGWPVWIDNIKVTSIKKLSYDGVNIPMIVYESDSLITEWEAIGPFSGPVTEIERSADCSKKTIQKNDVTYTWKPFEVDARGAVITGSLTEYEGNRPLAYFRFIYNSETENKVVLHFSTIDELGLWVNGSFYGFIYRNGYISRSSNDWNAWYDFWKNPEHSGRRVTVSLKEGQNQILIRTRNGQFASGGFFACFE